MTIATLACIVVPYLNVTIVRTIIGLIFVLSAPGYVVIAALFPSRNDISDAERAALSFGFSIGLLALVGLGLNYTPWGLRLESVLGFTTALTVLCVFIAVRRRGALSKANRFAVSLEEVRSAVSVIRPGSGARLDRALSIIALVSIIVSASVFAYLVAAPSNEHFTQLYVLGPYGKAADYPTNFTLGDTSSVVVGVTNNEGRDTTYELVVRLNDSGNATTLHTEQLTLGNGQTWQKPISLTPDKAGDGMKMEFLLYKSPDYDTPYREAYFWVNVTAP